MPSKKFRSSLKKTVSSNWKNLIWTKMLTDSDFKSELDRLQQRVETALDTFLPNDQTEPQRLHEAMRYSVFNGGKRIRPVLVYATGQAFGAANNALDAPAAAVELIHAYSLVHDDLPAMDDDDLRRGKPTCHIAYDEATAVLVGDGLQTLAFEILANDDNATVTPAARLAMIGTLAKASGSEGMVGGQAIDLEAVGKQISLDALQAMHNKKTGALISASTQLGALAAGVTDIDHLQRLDNYAKAIGLAFQVQDDILDVESDTETLGKTQGADVALNKPTYPALLGLDGAKHVAHELHETAMDALSIFDSSFDLLRAISAYIVQRSH
jgi:farnesyl diphosphate synthase